MKTILFALASFLLFSQPTFADSSPSSTIRIVHWNVFYDGQGTDGIRNRGRQVAELAALNPEVVTLNEVTVDAAADYARRLEAATGARWDHHHASAVVGGWGNAILTRLPIVSTSAYTMKVGASRSIAQATLTANGSRVNVFATHLDSGNVPQNRAAQVRELLTFLERLPAPRIVAGDFNARPDAAEIQPLVSNYDDLWMSAVRAGTARAYPANPPHRHTRTRGGRLDYIFASREVNVSECEVPDLRDLANTKVTTFVGTADDQGVRPSDHNLVACVVRVNGAPPPDTDTPETGNTGEKGNGTDTDPTGNGDGTDAGTDIEPPSEDDDSSDAPTLPADVPWASGRLEVASNGRFLQHDTSGKHFLYLADTPWSIFERLNREDVDLYMRDTAAKGFTVVQAVALWQLSRSGNAYGDSPVGLTDGRYDPTRILVTPGNDSADPEAYDYWDHVDFVLDKAEENGLYVALLPTWGNYVSGTTSWAMNMSSNIFTAENARTYGQFLGNRYGHRPNVIWVVGGDRAAVYPNGDFRDVWRSLAEGIGRGVSGQPLVWNEPHPGWDELIITYHPRRLDDRGSSQWFHDDPWLDFNGIETEHYDVVNKVREDWNLTPVKPTAVLEARYEDEADQDGVLAAGAFKQRYQLYHAIFSGSMGYAYGHRRIWRFSTGEDSWQSALNDPGRGSMKPVRSLLEGLPNDQLLNRVPDPTLLDGETGGSKTEDLLVAMRGGDDTFALVYTTNGRDIRFNLAKLATGTADAFWFSPRTGEFHDGSGTIVTGAFGQVSTGVGASIEVFDAPGIAEAGNDWVLKLVVRGSWKQEVVLHAASASIVGHQWTLDEDATAAGGIRLQEANDGTDKVMTPVADPTDFVEFTFVAQAGTAYRLWVRGTGPNYASDSVFVQFSGTVTASGEPVYRIGSTDATMYSVVGCDSCRRSGWGWQDNGWNGLGPLVYFAESGVQTLRLQRRQDGIAIDQIVLSPAKYLNSAPGAERDDRTILPATQPD